MKVIIIKVNDKVIGVSKINDITTKKFLELEKEVVENWKTKDEEVVRLTDRVSKLEKQLGNALEHISKLYHEIAVDRGEEE